MELWLYVAAEVVHLFHVLNPKGFSLWLILCDVSSDCGTCLKEYVLAGRAGVFLMYVIKRSR
jgi:hypothetical protein